MPGFNYCYNPYYDSSGDEESEEEMAKPSDMTDIELLTALAIQEDVLFSAAMSKKEILEEVRSRKNRLIEANRFNNQVSKNSYKSED